MDIKQRAADVAEEYSKLKGETHYVVSLKRRDRYQEAGRVFLVKRLMAARLIIAGTHELANTEQIKAYEAEMEERSKAIRSQQAKEDQKFSINLSPDLIASAVAASQAGKQ